MPRRELGAGGFGFRPDSQVGNDSLLWRTTFRLDTNGVTKTILISGPRLGNFTGPTFEMCALVGGFWDLR
jgi:hypothetical protein